MKRFSKRGLMPLTCLIVFSGLFFTMGMDSLNQNTPELQPETAETLQGKELLNPKVYRRLVIISGGQSGVDRAALDFALEHGIPCRGWCPKGRQAEDGTIDARYPLQETESELPKVRTEMNAIDSDGTLVLSWGNPTDGTKLTGDAAKKHGKPVFFTELGKKPDVPAFRKWIEDHNIRLLNIGGPRESFAPGEVYKRTAGTLKELLLK